MEAIVRARGGRILGARATDPLGREVEAAFALLDGGRVAVVEQAQASGLWRAARRSSATRSAASSHGTGELIAAAIDAARARCVVTVGGSATTDGGRGALEALGAHFTSRTRRPARAAPRAARREALGGVRRAQPDGRAGAARRVPSRRRRAPRRTQVEEIEERLGAWARLAQRTTGRDPGAEPMAGAGGGLAGGLWAFAGATLRPGAALVLDTVGFDARDARRRSRS